MKWLLFLLPLIIVPIVAAQTDCPAIVTAALNTATEACTGLGRNQACYGNVTLQATPRADAPAFSFEQAGDIVNVADVDSLHLSSMSLTDETWGVALMQLQANLPDTLPGQNVTMLLFGDVAITNASANIIALDVSANANVNVHLRPTTGESNVIGTLTSGETVTANGRLADGSWIRVVLNAETGELGWVSADFLTSDNDLDSLTIVEADTPLFAPMQAFYFTSSIGDSQCAEAPDSGILIQTPQGVGEVVLMVNEVNIRLGSTMYLQAGGGVMRVSVVEGHANLTADGVSQTVPAGTYAEIPLDNNDAANGVPTFPQPYNYADLQALPVAVALPQSVAVTPPLDVDDVESAVAVIESMPVSGTWQAVETVSDPGCTGGSTGSFSYSVNMTFSADGLTLFWQRESSAGELHYTDEMTYTGTYVTGSDTLTITFTSATSMTASHVSGSGTCTYTATITASFNG